MVTSGRLNEGPCDTRGSSSCSYAGTSVSGVSMGLDRVDSLPWTHHTAVFQGFLVSLLGPEVTDDSRSAVNRELSQRAPSQWTGASLWRPV